MNFLRIFLNTDATTPVENIPGDAQTLTGVTDMLDVLMLIMLVGFGVFALYSAFRLYREQMLMPNRILYPGDCKPEDCVQVGEFIDFIVPRAALLGAMLLVMGVALALNMYVFELDNLWIDISRMALPLAAFAWYVFAQRKAAKLFW